jgi:protein TonB
MNEQGDVLLDIRVERDGRVSEVRLKQSSGFDRLDRAAIDSVREWRFQPATVDGQPVAEWYRNWKWVFRLNS